MCMVDNQEISADRPEDWASARIVDDDLDQLVEFMPRIFQSLVIDPGRRHTRAGNSAHSCAGGSHRRSPSPLPGTRLPPRRRTCQAHREDDEDDEDDVKQKAQSCDVTPAQHHSGVRHTGRRRAQGRDGRRHPRDYGAGWLRCPCAEVPGWRIVLCPSLRLCMGSRADFWCSSCRINSCLAS
jgi:hypothetical protein